VRSDLLLRASGPDGIRKGFGRTNAVPAMGFARIRHDSGQNNGPLFIHWVQRGGFIFTRAVGVARAARRMLV